MITVFAQRKSAGKSTLLAQMAAKLAEDGSRVLIADADPQQTISNWSVYRQERPGVPRIEFVSVRKGPDLALAIERLKERFDHILVDLQGGDSPENRAALRLADKIVLPFKPSQPDLDNLGYIADMLETLREARPETEIHFVINEAPFSNSKNSEVAQSQAYFKSRSLELASSIVHSRKAYRDSMSTGLGVCELKDPKAKEEIRSLWSEIYKKGRLAPNAKIRSKGKQRSVKEA